MLRIIADDHVEIKLSVGFYRKLVVAQAQNKVGVARWELW